MKPTRATRRVFLTTALGGAGVVLALAACAPTLTPPALTPNPDFTRNFVRGEGGRRHEPMG